MLREFVFHPSGEPYLSYQSSFKPNWISRAEPRVVSIRADVGWGLPAVLNIFRTGVPKFIQDDDARAGQHGPAGVGNRPRYGAGGCLSVQAHGQHTRR